VSTLFLVIDCIELYQSDSNAVAASMCIALHRERTTKISQLFGVNESAASCDIQNYSE
jgi:hypothetical protein